MCIYIYFRYYFFGVEFETFYPQMPQKPKWVQLMYDEVIKLRPKRLPLADNHLYDMFKHFFGIKQAIKYKVQNAKLSMLYHTILKP